MNTAHFESAVLGSRVQKLIQSGKSLYEALEIAAKEADERAKRLDELRRMAEGEK